MKQDDFEMFSEMLVAISELYGKRVSDSSVGIWWGALKDYDICAVRKSFDLHVKSPDNGQYMPKPADIIRLISGNTQDSSLQAWAKVDSAVRRKGTYVSVVFDDAIIHRVIEDMGGWIKVGGHEEKEWPFVAKEFENRYRGYKSSGMEFTYISCLPGITDTHNMTLGSKRSDPIFIGNQEVAKKIYESGSKELALKFHDIYGVKEILGKINDKYAIK